MLPVVHLDWVDLDTYREALRFLLVGSRSSPSVVDCVGFETIDKHAIDAVFATIGIAMSADSSSFADTKNPEKACPLATGVRGIMRCK